MAARCSLYGEAGVEEDTPADDSRDDEDARGREHERDAREDDSGEEANGCETAPRLPARQSALCDAAEKEPRCIAPLLRGKEENATDREEGKEDVEKDNLSSERRRDADCGEQLEDAGNTGQRGGPPGERGKGSPGERKEKSSTEGRQRERLSSLAEKNEEHAVLHADERDGKGEERERKDNGPVICIDFYTPRSARCRRRYLG